MKIAEQTTRQLLIDSCHSSEAAERRILAELSSPAFVDLLVQIAVDADDYQGDAPMTAAYYRSLVSPALTKPHEPALLALLTAADGYSGSIALTLGRMQSLPAKPVIAQMLAQGSWPIETFRQAIACYAEA
jgi:hypothetical protein